MATQIYRRRKTKSVPQRADEFKSLDAWAKGLTVDSGRALSTTEKAEERAARRVGRPRKPAGQKVGRYMIAMDPTLHAAATATAKQAGISMSKLIADTLTARIKQKK